MKKLILAFITAFFLTQAADAELFKWGIKLGAAFSNLSIDDFIIDDPAEAYDLVTGDGVFGYHFGLQTQFNIALVVIKPELYFNAGGGTLEKVVDGGVSEALDVKFNRIDMPVLAGVKLGPVRINAGPVGSYVISENTRSDILGIPEDYEIFTRKVTWGFQAGLGVDLLKKISLDTRYEGSLSKLGKEFTIPGVPPFSLDARPRQWIFSLGIWF
jgi:opacity protein-like surface antigen